QSREYRGRLKAVGVAFCRRAVAHGMRAPRQQQSQHVTKIVTGIGEQRYRVRQDAINDLGGNQRDVQRGRQCKRTPEMRGLMCVALIVRTDVSVVQETSS